MVSSTNHPRWSEVRIVPLKITIDGKEWELTGFTLVRNKENQPMFAYKVKPLDGIILYYLWEDGVTPFEVFRKSMDKSGLKMLDSVEFLRGIE